MFKKYFKIIKEERVTGVLPYHIQQRYTIFFFIHWWGTPTFAPPHLHQTYMEAYNYIKEQCPNAIIQESLRDKCVREYGEHFGELYDKSCRGEPVDKIEPKFKVGDCIVNRLGNIWHIDSFDAKNYQVTNNKGEHGYFPINVQDRMHLWNIQDAKDGDVLRIRNLTFIFQEITNNNVCHKDAVVAYCSYEDNDDGFGVCGPDCITDLEIIIPAAKEQRDLLFQKMKEAGYEWDADKKELKKIDNEEVNGED